MSSIDEVVIVNINREAVGVTQTGFGTPLVLGQHTRFPELIKSYTSISEVADDFSTTDAEYKKALALFSQAVKPPVIKIGKRTANVAQVANISVPTVSDTTSYVVTLNGTAYEYVSGGGATASSIVDGLILAITAGGEPVTLTDNGNDFDITANLAGFGFSVTTTANLSVSATQANVSVVTNLQAIQDVDDDFYFVLLTSKTQQDIYQMAQYIEAQEKLFVALTNDADVIQSLRATLTLTFDIDFVTSNTIDLDIDEVAIAQTTFTTDQATTIGILAQNIQDSSKVLTATVTGPREITIVAENAGVVLDIDNIVVAGGASQAVGTVATVVDPVGDIGSILKSLNYNRTSLIYSSTTTNNLDGAWVGICSPEKAGSVNWSFKTLAGEVADALTGSQKLSAHSKNVNTYTTVGGIGITQNGYVSKSPNYIDVIRGDDFTKARLQEKILTILATQKKVSYTEAGLDIIRAGIVEVINLAISQGIYSEDFTPVINIPKVSAIPDADKNARLLQGITINVVRAGAINKVSLQLNISL